jgi:hypothetical protein
MDHPGHFHHSMIDPETVPGVRAPVAADPVVLTRLGGEGSLPAPAGMDARSQNTAIALNVTLALIGDDH